MLLKFTFWTIAALTLPLGNAHAGAFEVASVKPNHSAVTRDSAGPQERIDSVPGSLIIRYGSLAACIKWAFDVKDYQISGPAWLYTERYDILAKAASPVPLPQLRLMLQTLLEERFALQLHHETKELPIYALVAARTGPKLHKADPGGNTDMRAQNGSFVFQSTSMPEFADDLSGMIFVDRPVLDRTGIPGVFDFSLNFGDSIAELKRATLQGDGPSIFTIIQEQAGLKLEGQKGRIEMLVIDKVERVPTGN